MKFYTSISICDRLVEMATKLDEHCDEGEEDLR